MMTSKCEPEALEKETRQKMSHRCNVTTVICQCWQRIRVSVCRQAVSEECNDRGMDLVILNYTKFLKRKFIQDRGQKCLEKLFYAR